MNHAAFLRAMRELHADFVSVMRTSIEDARKPVQDEQLRMAVVQGIRSVSEGVVKAMNLRSWALIGLGGLGVFALGWCAGAFWDHGQMSAQIAAADERVADMTNRTIAVNDGFGTRLNVPNAQMWLWLIRLNPTIDFRDCYPTKQTGGQQCTLKLWTQMPPAATASK